MEKPCDYFLEIQRYVVIFDKPKSSPFWKAISVKIIAENARTILENNYQLELLDIFSREDVIRKKLLSLRIEALETITKFYIQSPFLEEIFEKIDEMRKGENPSLNEFITKNRQLEEFTNSIALSIKVLRKHSFTVVIAHAKMRRRKSILFKKNKNLKSLTI